jgi:CDP-glucose 4,6-dehydratase
MESVGEMNSFWRDRAVFVTGGTGLLGSWLVKQLLKRLECCVPGPRLGYQSRTRPQPSSNKSILCAAISSIEISLSARSASTKSRVVFHLAAQTIVGIANRSPVPTFSTNIEGTWNLARGLPPLSKGHVDSRGVLEAYGVRSISPYETMPCRAVILRRQQVLRRSDRADLRRQL